MPPFAILIGYVGFVRQLPLMAKHPETIFIPPEPMKVVVAPVRFRMLLIANTEPGVEVPSPSCPLESRMKAVEVADAVEVETEIRGRVFVEVAVIESHAQGVEDAIPISPPNKVGFVTYNIEVLVDWLN